MRNQQKKELARSLYIKSRFTRKEIAATVGVTEKTLRTWIQKENWDELKANESITRNQLLRTAYKQLQKINEFIDNELGGIPNKEMSDAKAVIRKEIETLSDRPLYIYIEVAEEFQNWLLQNHPKQLKPVSELLLEFIEHLAKNESM